MFGHKVLMSDESRMISQKVGQAGRCGGCCSHFDFAATEKGTQVVFVGSRMNAIEMGQSSRYDRGGWSRCDWNRRLMMLMMSIRLWMICLMSWSVGGSSGSRSCGYHCWSRSRRRRITIGSGCRWCGRGHHRRWIKFGVLAFAMTPQINFALERSAAMVASERFVTSVFPGVSDQVGWLAEGFPTDRALVRLFTCAHLIEENFPISQKSVKSLLFLNGLFLG